VNRFANHSESGYKFRGVDNCVARAYNLAIRISMVFRTAKHGPDWLWQMTSSPDRARVRALERGLSILTLLRDQGELSLTEISSGLALDKTTVLRLLNSLVEPGFVESNPDNRKYRLGLECITYGRKVSTDLALRRAAFSHLENLQRVSGESVTLAALHRRMVLPVEKLYGQVQDRVRSQWGGKALYLHSTALGKAMLAYFPASEIEAIYQSLGFPGQTAHTLTEWEDVQAELVRTRERGYSLDNSENMEGLCCVGAAIFGPHDDVVGAMSVSFPASAFNEELYLPIVPLLRRACLDVSQAIGAGDAALIRLAGWQTPSPQFAGATHESR
jgi:DNA-binding IclR family transcriptional regulator